MSFIRNVVRKKSFSAEPQQNNAINTPKSTEYSMDIIVKATGADKDARGEARGTGHVSVSLTKTNGEEKAVNHTSFYTEGLGQVLTVFSLGLAPATASLTHDSKTDIEEATEILKIRLNQKQYEAAIAKQTEIHSNVENGTLRYSLFANTNPLLPLVASAGSALLHAEQVKKAHQEQLGISSLIADFHDSDLFSNTTKQPIDKPKLQFANCVTTACDIVSAALGQPVVAYTPRGVKLNAEKLLSDVKKTEQQDKPKLEIPESPASIATPKLDSPGSQAFLSPKAASSPISPFFRASPKPAMPAASSVPITSPRARINSQFFPPSPINNHVSSPNNPKPLTFRFGILGGLPGPGPK
jgi:hypothetical protein